MNILRTDCALRQGAYQESNDPDDVGFSACVADGEHDLDQLDVDDDYEDETEELLCNARPVPHLEPLEVVEAWSIEALGRRPQDYLARDLLLNSLWRDERPRVFHNLAKKPPVWIEDHVRHLPGTQQTQAVQLTALHYLHRRQLARLWNGDDLDEPDQRRLLTKLSECWPYGAKVIPPAHCDPVAHGCWCRFAWLCPWCYARRAVRLERLLRDGPLRKPQGKHLVLARLALVGEQVHPDPNWEKRWGGRSGYYLQGPKKVRRMRRAITAKLRLFAREPGITGGIITHQISPWKTNYRRYGVAAGLASFRHDYALLGETAFADECQADKFRDDTEYHAGPYGLISSRHPDLRDEFTTVGIAWSFHPADDPDLDALRFFLAGSSVDYPVARLDWHVGGLTSRHLARAGVRGALALQPHFMMDEVQWWSYAETTRGLPLYVPFGTWRATIGEAKCQRAERRKAAVLLPSPARRTASRRRQALKDANARRKHMAREDLGRLLKIARPLLKQALAEQSGRRGRPAHRARLQALLAKEGYTVSEHRLKQLVRELRS